MVLRLTLESDPLPADFPVRQMSVTLDYGDTEVGGQVYTLPLSFAVDVRLRKRTQIRNESVFRSYQRFTSELPPACRWQIGRRICAVLFAATPDAPGPASE